MIVNLSEGSGSASPTDLEVKPGRLLYVIGQLALGGAERQLYYLLATLDHARYRPALVAWNFNPDEKYYGDIAALDLPIYGLPAIWSPITKLRAFRKLAQQIAPEVIHSYGFHTNFAAYFAAKGCTAVPIGSLRSDFATIKKVGGAFRGALNARWPNYHIANSTVCVEAARHDGSFFTPRHFSVVRNGLDLNYFRESDVPLKARTYIASLGSLLPVKRWDRLLRVVQKVRTLVPDSIQFRIAGDGPLRSMLERQASEMGISDIVKFIGATQDVPTFLSEAKFLVHTSQSEGCPNVVMEAMAAGRAVVATDAGDVPHLVEDGKTGFVVRRGDEECLTNRIVTLLTDSALCQQMERNARTRAEQDFNIESLVSGTLEAYRLAGWKDLTYRPSSLDRL